MTQSMTGFAEKRFDSKSLSARFSIKTLNHRFLDWNYRGTQIGEVENRLRAICQRKFHRGRVEVALELSFLDPSSWDFRINEGLLRKIFVSLEKFSSKRGKSISLSVENLFSIPQVVVMKSKKFSKEEVIFLETSFEKTLEEVLNTRRREGREIAKEIRIHVQNINKVMNRIEHQVRKQPFLIQDKLKQRLRELNNECSLPEEKLAEEAAYIAQRYDLTEEIKRLKSHLKYVQEVISQKKEEPVGKKLDFVAQELYREANTINSKSQNIEVIRGILTIKGEIESIRQQVQNIE